MVTDTIVAVSSPIGNSLKGIIRLSGNRAFRLINNTVRPADRLTGKPTGWQSLRCVLNLPAAFGEPRPSGREWPGQAGIRPANRPTGRPADSPTSRPVHIPVTLYLMPAPYSYTREDVVEIHTFGSKVLLESILQYFIQIGRASRWTSGQARLAQPGEFTRRAFINGRISLAQSEAVLNIIHSSSEREHRLAVNQLHQHSFRQLREINQQLIDLVSQMELALDFSDQDIEIISHKQIKNSLKSIIIGINKTLKESSGRAINTDGITCVLCGRPNVGKSSLFNCLVTSRKNIVSPIPGTTRDYIEGEFLHKNTVFRIFDTAGIPLGIPRRASQEMPDKSGNYNLSPVVAQFIGQEADINLLIIDGSQGLVEQDRAILKRLNPSKTILVVNKTDLSPLSDNRHTGTLANWKTIIKTSALTSKGIPDLKNALVALAKTAPPERSSDRTLINLRQQENLRASLELLNKALSGAKRGASYEFIALDLNDALEQLNLALGSFSAGTNLGADGVATKSRLLRDDILNNIFSRFCIGK